MRGTLQGSKSQTGQLSHCSEEAIQREFKKPEERENLSMYGTKERLSEKKQD